MNINEALKMIKDLRDQKGLSQEDVVQFFGLAPNSRITYGYWENGEANVPKKHRARFLLYLAEDLGLKDYPDRLIEVWNCVSQKWKWTPLSEVEKKKFIQADTPKSVEWDKLTPDGLLAKLKSADPGVSTHAIKTLCERMERGELGVETLLKANDHPYWMIRKLAIEKIIQLGLPNTLDLLYEFRNTSYQVSQRNIREYILKRFQAGTLNEDEIKRSIDLIDHLIHAPKVTDISLRKNEKLKKKLQDGSLDVGDTDMEEPDPAE